MATHSPMYSVDIVLQEVLNLFVDRNQPPFSHLTGRGRNCSGRHRDALCFDGEVRLLVRGVLLLGLRLTGKLPLFDVHCLEHLMDKFWSISKSWRIRSCVHHACNKDLLSCGIWLNRVRSAWIRSTLTIDPLKFRTHL